MRIVVDSNIVFIALLNDKSKIGQIIILGAKKFEFYAPLLLKKEIEQHADKIISISKISAAEFKVSFDLITNRITFIDEMVLSEEIVLEAEQLVRNVDENDFLFVALTNHLSARLWTGDKRLINGLSKKGYTQTITTEELFKHFSLDYLLRK
jgi:predicted nucleic acid-binding protein